MDYIKPKSTTFWAGVSLIVSGAILAIHPVQPLGDWADIFSNMVGNQSPSVLIAQGVGLIGIRKAIGS